MSETEGPDPKVNGVDRARLTFSEAQGYEELPQPLRLEEISYEARLRIWDLIYQNCISHVEPTNYEGEPYIVDRELHFAWNGIFKDMHSRFLLEPIDSLELSTDELVRRHKLLILEDLPFNRLFDLLQMMMRDLRCPDVFITEVANLFSSYRLAYVVDTNWPATILPAATECEGVSTLAAIRQLRSDGLSGAVTHLGRASERINQGDWAGAIRESIHAVESVARNLDSGHSNTLEPALQALAKQGGLHPALKSAFSKLYGYTSNEQGIRHALLEGTEAKPGLDEAVFMLGACAAFASYLSRKHGEESQESKQVRH